MDDELSPGAKLAIQAYIAKVVLPVGAVFTVVSGLAGYIVSGTAQLNAAQKASEIAYAAAQSAAEARANATFAFDEARKASDRANQFKDRADLAATESEKIASDLREAKAAVESVIKGQYSGFAKLLYDSPSFQEAVSKFPESWAAEIRLKIEKIEHSIYGGNGDIVQAPGGVCPPETYAVRLSSTSVSGGRSGYVESVMIQCRGLRFPQPS